MEHTYIAVLQVEGEDFEVKVFDDGEQLLERPYFCKGFDSVIDTAKLLRKEKFPSLAIYKQMLNEEAVKIIG